MTHLQRELNLSHRDIRSKTICLVFSPPACCSSQMRPFPLQEASQCWLGEILVLLWPQTRRLRISFFEPVIFFTAQTF